MPAQMTSVLKNKADFYQLVHELGMDGFCLPDYKVSSIYDVAKEAHKFLGWIEDVYKSEGRLRTKLADHHRDMLDDYLRYRSEHPAI